MSTSKKRNYGGKNMENREIIEILIKTYGVNTQLDIAVEELAELIQSICKYKRYGTEKEELDLLEEMADVEIMLSQLKSIFNLDQRDIDRMKDYKLTRQIGRMKEKGLI